jgi:antitoxin HicB
LVVAKAQNKHLGSSVDDFLAEEGIYEEVTAVAWKRVLAWEVSEAMRKEGISKSEMAKRMKTSRSQLARFLDPDNPSVLLETVQKAAAAIGKQVTIGLIDAPRCGVACKSTSLSVPISSRGGAKDRQPADVMPQNLRMNGNKFPIPTVSL